jgi:FtsZ-interacting cell division protein ZipA
MRGTDEAALDTMLASVLQMIVDLGGEPLDLQRG